MCTMVTIYKSNTYLCLFHTAELALILQKLGEWDGNLLAVTVTGILYRAISAPDF